MGRFTQVPLPHRQALNETLVFTSRASNVVPLARKRPGDAVAEQRLARGWMRPWSPPDRLGR